MMLRQLFRSEPKWQSPKSHRRIEALAELNVTDEKELRILLKLAREDSEPAVRREAVKYLHDLEALTQIQKRDLDASVREAATQRLHDLLAGKHPGTLSLEQRLQGLRRISTPSTLAYLIREADHIDLKLAAIDLLSDEIYLDDIARHSGIARLRLAAAERIATPAVLEALAEASKQKDKNVYKAIRARLDQSAQAEKDAQALREKREALCVAMEHHAHAALNPLYTAKAESLRQQWQEVNGAQDVQLSERFETAFALSCQQISEAAAAAQRIADEAQAREEMQQCVFTLEATLQEYQGQEEFDLPALAALRKTQRLRWELAAKLQIPATELAGRYAQADAALDRLEQMLAQWQQDRLVVETTLLRLPEADAAEKTQSLHALHEVRKVYRDFALPLPLPLQHIPEEANEKPADNPAIQSKTELHEKLNAQLDALAVSIQAGNSRVAAKKLRKAQDFARENQLHDHRLGELADQVHELQSWAGFAVQPKKEDLISKMQTLITHEMDPDDKADAIHALQEEWKALGVAESAVEQPLWERFKAAGDQAFEPCRAHFSAQRELRLQNLEKRTALCVQLENYLAALPEKIDWKQHDAILRRARQEWQQHHPSDRQKTLPVQERFSRTLKSLESLLHEAQKKHEAEKRALIVRIQELLKSSDMRAACDQAKQMQQEWKHIGQAGSKAEHKLWQEFRSACDALFGRRETEFKARQASREAVLQQAQELITAYESLAKGDARAHVSEAARLEEAFGALSLPREKAESLRQRFNRARHQLEQARRDQVARARLEKREVRLQEWESKATHVGESQTAKAELLLLDLEILLDIPSPESLHAARRERQMQLLQLQGLRRSSRDHAQEMLDELMRTPVASEALPMLTARLRTILQKMEN